MAINTDPCRCNCHYGRPYTTGHCNCDNNITRIDEKISNMQKFSVIVTNDLLERISVLEKKCNDLEELIYETRERQRNCDRKPFKCPVCDGEGEVKKDIHPKLAEFERLPTCLAIYCKACEGRGIVWG